MMTEGQIEQLCLDWFQEGGWLHAFGPDIAPDGDSPNRKYSILSYTLEFKNTALKEIGFKHRESGLIVQALKALGKERITSEVIEKIRT
ncbi:DUF6088 family protein [uncultured Desulfuromonas sp.]|uniref:DUF6088 family protein n=1 Tax=uncultured Desulfuromonas sp. TaxID=181013 RepID=UPI00374DE8B9